MRKTIDIDDLTLTKLKILSESENLSVKAFMQQAVQVYIKQKEQDHIANMSNEEKEDYGLWLLMQEGDRNDTVSEEEIFKYFKN